MPTIPIFNTVFVPKEGILDYIFPLPPKFDIEKIYYAIDISARVLDGDSISSVIAQSNDNSLNITNIEIDADKSIVSFMVSGGMPNQVSIIWFMITSKLGEARSIVVSNSNISPVLPDNIADTLCGECNG